jgi:hypothetical protein
MRCEADTESRALTDTGEFSVRAVRVVQVFRQFLGIFWDPAWVMKR